MPKFPHVVRHERQTETQGLSGKEHVQQTDHLTASLQARAGRAIRRCGSVVERQNLQRLKELVQLLAIELRLLAARHTELQLANVAVST